MYDSNDAASYAEYRRRRVRRLKKIIKIGILSGILIPLISCVILVLLYVNARRQLDDMTARYDDLLSSMESLKDEIEYLDEEQDVYSVSEVTDSPRQYTEDMYDPVATIDRDAEDMPDDIRRVYLTFDDGPSSYTDEILDILDEYGVKATFFVVGKTDDVSVNAYKRIVEDGHTLGMHSYSHRYSQIYASREAFVDDLNLLQEYLYETTGVWSHFYRFPGGSSNTASNVSMDELIDYLKSQDITYFDWNIVSGDATGYTVSADSIYNNCVSKLGEYSVAVILMHDASGKHTTVEALPRIIETIQGMENTVILPIDDDTYPIQHRTVND